MTTNYLPFPKRKWNKGDGQGPYYDPSRHKYTDQEKRNRYYAYLKHRVQARYRKEHYELTPDQWFELWTPELFAQRGRGADNLTLYRVDPSEGWSFSNCAITTRKKFLNSNGFRKRGQEESLK